MLVSDGVIHAIDQTALPSRVRMLSLRSTAQLAEAIVKLRIRGAPMLGIAGAILAALLEVLRVGDEVLQPIQRLVEALRVDHKALLVQADGYVLKINVDRYIFRLDTQQRIERLKHNLIGKLCADQDVIKAPHAHAGVARRLHPSHQWR